MRHLITLLLLGVALVSGWWMTLESAATKAGRIEAGRAMGMRVDH